MNAPLRRVAVAVLVLFGLLLVNANYVQVVQARDLRTDSRNSRVLVQEYERERGSIVVGGEAVAVSTKTDDRLEYLRTYPGGPAYSHVLGYYSLLYGATGMERASNEVLSGADDRLFVRRLSDLVTGRTPKGGNVVLTLLPRAQLAAYEALEGQRGAVVALDPRTGAILALASRPSYDANPLASHDPQQIREAYRKLDGDPANPLLNRALSSTYPPGSTFKVVTAAAALAAGATPESQLESPDRLDLPLTDATIGNFGGETCGNGRTTTLADALRISCNTAFANLGLDLGAQALGKQARAFGLGEELEVPLQVAESVFPDELDPPSLAQSAIGQRDVRVTPLQAAMIAAGVANDGVVMKPYLVDSIQGADFSVVDSTDAEELSTAMRAADARALTEMMKLVVADGTGTRAQIPGVEVAGKTGTAQNAPGAPPHAWFIGFAPADNPEVAVAVVVERGGSLGSEATGGRVAAPIARAVMEAVLRGTQGAS